MRWPLPGDLTGSVSRRAHRGPQVAGHTPITVYDLTLRDVRVAHVGVTHVTGDARPSITACRSSTARSRWSPRASMATAARSQNGEFGYDVTNTHRYCPFSVGSNAGGESSSASGMNYFLALDGAKGDVDRRDGLGWFEVNSFNLDMEGAGLKKSGILTADAHPGQQYGIGAAADDGDEERPQRERRHKGCEAYRRGGRWADGYVPA